MAGSSEHHTVGDWLKIVLIGKPFWELRGGKVLHAVVMSSIVAFTLQLFDGPVREFVDTTVQSTLLNQMAEPEYAPPPCTGPVGREATNCISVVGVDDADFREVFKQQSPLNPVELQKLFDRMVQQPPRIVAIDLDLSPASEDELPARDRLRKSLVNLSKVTQVVMVCPQGYSTPKPSELDKQWVLGFGENISFASADLGADGLYYNIHVKKEAPNERDDLTIQTLGVVTAKVFSSGPGQSSDSSNLVKTWHEQCQQSALSITRKSENIERKLLLPRVVNAISFSQALDKPESLANRVVLLGGKWGINDRYTLRGQTDQFFGVTLHAWAVASEVAPSQKLTEPEVLILEVCIGLLSGFIFALIWKGVYTYRKSYALRSMLYTLFFLFAVFLPLAFIAGAAHLAKIGLTLGVAGMILSAAADSLLSSHEVLLEHEEKEKHSPPYFLAAAKAMLCITFEKGKEFLFHPYPLRLVWIILTLLSGWLFSVQQPMWAGAIVGVTFGIALGLADAKETHSDSKIEDPESVWDLAFRFAWLCAKVAAVAWAMAKFIHEGGYAAPAMVCIFGVAWVTAFRVQRFVTVQSSARR